MFGKILVTTDLSETSYSAFPVAKEIAAKFGSTISLLSVVEEPFIVSSFPSAGCEPIYDPTLREALKDKISKELASISKTHFPSIPITTKAQMGAGSPYLEIIQFAKDESIDLIILASRGRTGVSRLLLGSVAERVVREAPCATLIVPGTR